MLKAVDDYDDGKTAFDAFHTATTETRPLNVLSSEKDYEDIEVKRVLPEPTDVRDSA